MLKQLYICSHVTEECIRKGSCRGRKPSTMEYLQLHESKFYKYPEGWKCPNKRIMVKSIKVGGQRQLNLFGEGK